ncbi:XRE family transcriptional regulator [Thalassotalea insulae]|uniref:XRE family transcriptional regulator n=1 Tax=Thalassotalea insulae TaxID=2056778 RepID=A0ABQ6GU14_9GAMM|nr:RodZ domain-containing protein [Thalassotalea insulae]GLX79392.1 XRE family transcriptional regulator [Thalassotalea insulae]
MSNENTVADLSEDIEVVGPGQMLAEARTAIGLSQQQVADKLNFRTALVKEIEQDIFDKTLPDTFNRGYLKNYAKLVNISVSDVLASYEMLNVAQQQCAEMQSFSKQTEKQAENNRIMWLSYLILALLIGSTIVWWLQDSKQNQPQATAKVTTRSVQKPQVEQEQPVAGDQQITITSPAINDDSARAPLADTLVTPSPQETKASVEAIQPLVEQDLDARESQVEKVAVTQDNVAETETDFGTLESAQFTFSGDCWVNIYDATGERIAWGIKKSGYVMNISGQAPFTITLGKPELVSIVFEQQAVDMSQFSQGNIAKFTLPIE